MLATLRPLLSSAARGERTDLPGGARAALVPAVIAGLVVLVSPWVTTSLTTDSGARWVLAYVGGEYWWSYFPWFPWLAYPLLGFACYQVGSQTLPASRDGAVARRWRMAGLGVLVAYAVGVAATAPFAVAMCYKLPRYYHHDVRFFGWTCAFLAVWVSLHRAGENWWGNTSALRWLKALGRNVTLCYVVQWLIIGNVATALYKTESLLHWALWVVAVVTVTSVVACRHRDRHGNRRATQA
jgi:ascorbate-specific PTS system EIIC-type component UlaA